MKLQLQYKGNKRAKTNITCLADILKDTEQTWELLGNNKDQTKGGILTSL